MPIWSLNTGWILFSFEKINNKSRRKYYDKAWYKSFYYKTPNYDVHRDSDLYLSKETNRDGIIMIVYLKMGNWLIQN
jgi:hypothetical protein